MNIDLFLVFWFFVFYYFPILGCGFPSTPLRVLMLRLQVLVLKRTRRCSCPGFVASALPTKVNNLCRLSARLFSSKLEGAEEEEEEGLESRRGEEEQLRRSARRFVASALEPNIATWEQQRRIPREVYRQAGELGLLQVGFAEPWGYGGDDPHLMIALQVNTFLFSGALNNAIAICLVQALNTLSFLHCLSGRAVPDRSWRASRWSLQPLHLNATHFGNGNTGTY